MMKFQIYEAKDGWRWRLKANNGRTTADSGEAYVTKANARRAIKRIAAELDLTGAVIEAD